MKEFDLEELAAFNGEDGKSVYIAHKGKVFDVTESKVWKGGIHMKRHHAGTKLTTDIQAAPHGEEVLEKYPQVGVLKKEVEERQLPKALTWLLTNFPLLRRHPHPMTVHFPIVFMFSVTVFNVLYVITGVKAFETTALHCLGAGILFTIVAVTTGYYTWWLNYQAKPVRAVTIKRPVSIILFVLQIVAFVWRIQVPGILDTWGGVSVIYFIIVLSFLPLVTVMGWYGAQMTFPIEKD